MSGQHSNSGLCNRSRHFLEELDDLVFQTEERLAAAQRKRAAVETFHDRMVAKVEADDLPPSERAAQLARLDAQRRGLAAGIDITGLEAEHRHAEARHRLVFDTFLAANRYSLERVIRREVSLILLGADVRPTPKQREALTALAAALRDYLWRYPSDEADRRIRTGWARLEATLAA